MNKKAVSCFVVLVTFSAGVATLVGTSGCVAVAAGAGAGAAVAYVRGELDTTLSADFEQTARAADRAITELQFAKVAERKDALLDIITARTAADKKVEVRIENVARNLTRVKIRIGLFGDEALSLSILDHIKSNL
jgi:hypothetical protein